MLKGDRILELLNKTQTSKTDLYIATDISRGTLENIINGRNTSSIDKLERIANFFNVSMDYFFDRDFDGDTSGTTIQMDKELIERNKEIEYLKEILNEKERTIKILMAKQNV